MRSRRLTDRRWLGFWVLAVASCASSPEERLSTPRPSVEGTVGDAGGDTDISDTEQRLRVEANRAKIEHDVRSICHVAKMFYVETGTYPASIGQMVHPIDVEGENLVGLESYPKDPWGRDYVFTIGDSGPTVMCLGADGNEGGEGEDADITYPPPE